MKGINGIVNITRTKSLFTRWKTLLIVNSLSKSYSKACKKDLGHPMQRVPLVSEVESGWYEWWEENNFFKKTSSDSKFVMLLPPPNVTGKLHMGHALTCALQDAIVRWNHMNGHKVLWVPGCDHAGIATQVVVERHLWETERLTRHDLGKEKFVNEVLKWKEGKEKTIYTQMKRMGVALDWDRSFFTMDPNISEAVVAAFVRLFEEGVIYRGVYMINWCSALQSVISDFEVEKLEIEGPTDLTVPGHEKPVSFGYMYDIKYQLVDSDEKVNVSTTRPETVLGDTALMVHPDDPRYIHLHGKKVLHPFRGDHIPIVTDASVSKEIGTGVVKVTPGHSFQDYTVAKRHNLPVIELFDDRGWITSISDIQSQPRYAARKVILDILASKGLLGERKPHSLLLSRCMRSGDVIEPRLKMQWFLSMKEMTDAALRAVNEHRLRFHPPECSKLWQHFLSDERDWCISRQLWWGHVVPIYWASTRHDTVFGREEEVKEGSSAFVAAVNDKEATTKAARTLGVEVKSIKSLQRESDVLDTWFSSSILPFAVFGWPEEDARDLSRYFPLSLMETGEDILFFWVARMVMMSLKLTGKLPFKDVLLHGLVSDAKGQKMSKSKGNTLDPLDIIEGSSKIQYKEKKLPSYGADALRFSLCSFDLKRRSIHVNFSIIEEVHLFKNKMWQTVRFFKQNLQNIPDGEHFMEKVQNESSSDVMDKWLLSHLARMVSDAHEGFTTYNVHMAANSLKEFWYSYLCDVYLETCKPRLWNHSTSPESARECLRVLWSSCHTGLLVLSPFMPFLAEELYGHLPSAHPKEESITKCPFPRPEEWNGFRDDQLEDDMKSTLEAASALRNLRNSYNITSKSPQGKASIFINNERVRGTAQKAVTGLQRLCFLSELQVLPFDFDTDELEPGLVMHPVCPGVTVQLHLRGMINPEIESTRLNKKLSKLQKKREEVSQRILRFEAKQREPKESDTLKMNNLDDEIKEIHSVLQNVEKMQKGN